MVSIFTFVSSDRFISTHYLNKNDSKLGIGLIPVIPRVGRLKQENYHKLEVSLGLI